MWVVKVDEFLVETPYYVNQSESISCTNALDLSDEKRGYKQDHLLYFTVDNKFD